MPGVPFCYSPDCGAKSPARVATAYGARKRLRAVTNEGPGPQTDVTSGAMRAARRRGGPEGAMPRPPVPRFDTRVFKSRA